MGIRSAKYDRFQTVCTQICIRVQKNRHIQINPTQTNIGTTSLGQKIIPHQATESRIPAPPRPRPREHRAGSGATLPVPAGQAAHRLWRRLYGGQADKDEGFLAIVFRRPRDPFRITTPAGDFLNTPCGGVRTFLIPLVPLYNLRQEFS